MSTTTGKQRTYDHRLRELVQTTRNIQTATRHGVPASTARGWLNKLTVDVVSIDVFDLDTLRLQREEVNVIHEMVTSPEYRHLATSSLARLAQRLGKVFASSAPGIDSSDVSSGAAVGNVSIQRNRKSAFVLRRRTRFGTSTRHGLDSLMEVAPICTP